MSDHHLKRGSESPGGPGVKTPRFHCKGHGSDPWLGTPHAAQHGQKKKKEEIVLLFKKTNKTWLCPILIRSPFSHQ